MQKLDLYHPFLYRYLYKTFQVAMRDKNFHSIDVRPTVSEESKWIVGVASRNTFNKIKGEPSTDQKNSKTSTSSLNALSEKIVEIFFEDDYKNLLDNKHSEWFLTFIKLSNFPEVVPKEYYDLGNRTNIYYIDFDSEEKNRIDSLVNVTINYNFNPNFSIENNTTKNIQGNLTSNSICEYFTYHQKISEKVIRFGVFPCQDTILPMYFESDFNINLNVKFIEFENWSQGLEAFRQDLIDVAVHNFSTVLASLIKDEEKTLGFFWPFFTFDGYGLFIRQTYLQEKIEAQGLPNMLKRRNSSFNRLPLSVQKEVLRGSKIIVERGTDFEWAVHHYFSKKGLDFQKNEYELIDYNTNFGKGFFIKGEGDLYCTNPIHVLDVIQKIENKSANVDFNALLIAEGQDFKHKNFNGLIATSEFATANKKIMAELVHIWFKSMNYFDNVMTEYRKNMRVIGSIVKRTEMESDNMVASGITDFLNEYSDSKVTPSMLMDMFVQYNDFFLNPKNAFDTFFSSEHIENGRILQNYIEITGYHFEKMNETSKKDFEQIMNIFKKQMQYYY